MSLDDCPDKIFFVIIMKNTEDIVLVLNSLKINEIISEGLVESAKCGNVWFNDANIGEGFKAFD